LRIHLAGSYVALGDNARALDELERARPLVTAAGAPATAAAMYHEHRAQVLSLLGRSEEAVDAMRAAVAAHASMQHTDPKYVAAARLNLAAALTEAGDHADALRVATTAIDELTAATGCATPHCANGYTTMGGILMRLGRRGDARAAYEKALVLYRGMQTDPAFVALAKARLAELLPAGEHVRALALAHEALDAWRHQPDAWREEIADVEAWLARHRRVLR
jgi:tetratricopeptide (TPR) repeat protein